MTFEIITPYDEMVSMVARSGRAFRMGENMAPRTKKATKAKKARRGVRLLRDRFTGSLYYVGCRDLDRYITDCAVAGSGLVGTFAEAEARAQQSVNKDGKTRYIVRVVAKIERVAPPLKTIAL